MRQIACLFAFPFDYPSPHGPAPYHARHSRDPVCERKLLAPFASCHRSSMTAGTLTPTLDVQCEHVGVTKQGKGRLQWMGHATTALATAIAPAHFSLLVAPREEIVLGQHHHCLVPVPVPPPATQTTASKFVTNHASRERLPTIIYPSTPPSIVITCHAQGARPPQ